MTTELFENLDRLRHAEGKVAVATLVNTRGTTPRKEGAKMLVGEDGRVLGSVTIGGCVDAQVFVEPVDFREGSDETLRLYERLRKHAEGGGRGTLLTRLDPPGNGAKLLVLDTGEREGGLGSASLDGRATTETQAPLRAGKSTTLTVDGTRIFAEVFAPPSIMLIVGAGHVSMPLTSLARIVGFKTIVIDGRPRFATRERFPDVDELKIGIPSELVQSVPLGPTTALVLVAHDYKYDLPVLKHALSTNVGYIGMLGSARRGA